MPAIEVSTEGRVATVAVNRPEALNAMNSDVLREMLQAFVSLGHREDVGAVILTGSGSKAFIAGADISEMKDMSPEEASAFVELGQMVTTTIERIPQPVIAAVNGFALGGGCEVALACDIRLCAENARFGQPEINLGVIPGWGGTQRLARLCGLGFARELVYTARVVDAEEARKWGLVNSIHPPEKLMEKAQEMASKIAGKSGVAMRYAKQATDRALEQDLAGGLQIEAALFTACFSSGDQKEGMSAFLDKRTPDFKHK